MLRCSIRKDSFIIYFLFIFFPLYTIPWVVKGMLLGRKEAFVLWAIFMGLLGVLYPPIGDIYQYTKDYFLYKDCSWDYFLELVAFKFDYVLSLMSYFLGKIGLNFEVCRFLYNFIGYYLLGSLYISILSGKNISLYNKYDKYYLLGFFIAFNIITFLWRFGFSSILFVYGCYQIVFLQKKKGWIFVLISALNHFSFLLFFIFLCLQQFHLFRFKRTVVMSICIFSLFINGSTLAAILPYLPYNIVQRYSIYLDGYYATEYFADHSWKYQLQVFLNSFVTYVACYFYILTYKNEDRNILSLTNAVLCLACLSLPFDTMRMRFLALLLLCIKLSFMWFYDGSRLKAKALRIMFWCVMMGNVINFWGIRRQLDVSEMPRIFYSNVFQVLSFTYDEKWIDKNVSPEGGIIQINY